MTHIRTSAAMLLLNVSILLSYSMHFQSEQSDTQYNNLLESNQKLSLQIIGLKNDIQDKSGQMKILKENAAYLLALQPIARYFTEEELFILIDEIPKGNPFETDFLVTASFGESTGFFPREDHGGMDGIPVHPEDMEWGIYPIGDGVVVSDGIDPAHGKNILIQHSDRIMSRYSHLSKYYYEALTGKEVTIDTLIGEMGNTGFSTRAHLHIEIWIKVNETLWVKIDPRAFLKRSKV